MKIKVGTHTYPDIALHPFKTEQGHDAVRLIGEVPQTISNGFKAYSDDDILLGDYSEYIYKYRDNEYSIADDTPSECGGGYSPVPEDSFSRLSSKVNECMNDLAQINNVIGGE